MHLQLPELPRCSSAPQKTRLYNFRPYVFASVFFTSVKNGRNFMWSKIIQLCSAGEEHLRTFNTSIPYSVLPMGVSRWLDDAKRARSALRKPLPRGREGLRPCLSICLRRTRAAEEGRAAAARARRFRMAGSKAFRRTAVEDEQRRDSSPPPANAFTMLPCGCVKLWQPRQLAAVCKSSVRLEAVGQRP